MARIRTIKPEFPHSESIGRLSRDARLLFIQLWTIADDEGRGRGAVPVLVGTLYPYDTDAALLIGGWLEELITSGCIALYQHSGTSYFQILKWSSHQKIDRPTPSRYPAPDGELTNRLLESDIENAVFEEIKSSRTFSGEDVVDIQRQARVGSSYIDILVKTATTTYVLEVKKDRVTGSDIAQVLRYSALVGGVPVLIGTGLSSKLTVDECSSAQVAVFSYTKDCLSLLVPNKNVIDCSITLASVIERSSTDLVPSTLDLGPSTKDDDDSTREALVSEGSNKLADEIAVVVGHDLKFVPPAWCGASYTVQKWLSAGWRPELILASVREQMGRRKGDPPDRITYFEKGIAASHARHDAPLPTAKIIEGETVNVARATENRSLSSVARQAAEFADEIARGDRFRDEGGGGPIRVIHGGKGP